MYTKRGTISRTQGQIKKHYADFTHVEKELLKSKMKGLDLHLSHHAKSKRYINPSHMVACLKAHNVIEFNHIFGRNDNRVLIRSKGLFKLPEDEKIYNICLVISLEKSCIITFYYNLTDDCHDTLDPTRYINFSIDEFI